MIILQKLHSDALFLLARETGEGRQKKLLHDFRVTMRWLMLQQIKQAAPLLGFHAFQDKRIIQKHRCLDNRSLRAAVVSNGVTVIKPKRSQQVRKRLHTFSTEIIRINHRLHVLHLPVTPQDRHLHKYTGALANGVPDLWRRQTPYEMAGEITSVVRFP